MAIEALKAGSAESKANKVLINGMDGARKNPVNDCKKKGHGNGISW